MAVNHVVAGSSPAWGVLIIKINIEAFSKLNLVNINKIQISDDPLVQLVRMHDW